MILIFVRHGERLDQVESLGKKIIYPECDPPLTDNGKKMASDSALLTRDYLI
jgi:broad specificity phosphatase PhoE